MHISRLELSIHVSHVCLMAARVQLAQWSIHITLRGDNKKREVGRRRIQTSIKCSYITVCANGQRLTDNVFLFQQEDACFY